MKKYTYIIMTIILLVFGYFYYNYNKVINFNKPLNEIKSIKHKKKYGLLNLTIKQYKNKEIIAGFSYKKRKAIIKFVLDDDSGQMNIIKIGDESDYFLFALSELFEAKTSNCEMKDTIPFSICRKGDDPSNIDLFDKATYILSYKPYKEKINGSVELGMNIDMNLGSISLYEKNGGIAKRNLIEAFKKNNRT